MEQAGSIHSCPYSEWIVFDEDHLIEKATKIWSHYFERIHKILSSGDVLLSSEGTIIIRGANVGKADLIRPPFSTLPQLPIASLHRLTHDSPLNYQHDRRSSVRLWRMVRARLPCLEGEGQNPAVFLNALRRIQDRTKTRNQVLRKLKHCDEIYEPSSLGKGGNRG